MNKQIYLTSDYEALIAKNGYFVDKTPFIRLLEGSSNPNIFFLRPRRFGKSLTLSMLEHYYGIQYKDRFDELFGQFFIGQPENTTPLKNSYYILKFNFSGIETQKSELIIPSFISRLIDGISQFTKEYGILSIQDLDEIFSDRVAMGILSGFVSKLKQKGFDGKIYLMIDEYDHFTNDLFSFNQNNFKEIVSRNGWVRKFYETIKIYMGEGVIDRFFATGVTPVTLDSMTSGFNVATNLTLDVKYHNMAGFTEAELKRLIEGTFYEEGKFDLEQLLKDMRTWFNGSRFSPDGGEKLYNPQLVLSFLSNFKENFSYPKIITDNNVTSDWKKISNILGLLSQPESDDIIEQVYINESIEGGISTQFNPETPYRFSDAISLLFYNGLLTIEKEEYGIIKYVIPNYVIKTIFWEYLRIVYEERHKLSLNLTDMGHIFKEMARDGKINALVEETAKIMEPLTSNDYQNFRESNLKMIVISLLSLNKIFIIHSEMEVTDGRVDLLLTKFAPYDSKYQFLIEFKYLKIQDEPDYEKKKNEGIAQLQKYKSSPQVQHLVNLKSYLVMFHNKRESEIIEV